MAISKIPDGYKQTEVGVIPEDWQTKKLEEICHPSKIRLNPVTSSNNFKCVELEHLSQGTGRLLGYIDSSEQLSQKTFFKKGDVLFGKLRPYLKKFLFPTFEGVCSSEIWVLNSINNIESKWLYYLIQTDKILEAANQSTGTKMPRAEWNIVGNVFISIPPTREEQSAIATALSDTDTLISSLEQLIAKKRAIKQGAMEELLTGKRRLNHGLNGLKDDTDFKKSVKSINPCQSVIQTIKKGYKQTEVGVIPEDWEVKRLVEIVEIDSDTLPSSTNANHVFKYIALEDVDNGVLRNTTEVIFKNAPSRARRKIKKDDVLISTVRPNLKSHLWIKEEIKDWICSTGFSVIRCKKNIVCPGYIFNHLFYFIIEKQIDTLITGSNYPAINSSDVKSLQIPLPTLTEQTAIAEILSDMDTEIESLEQKLEKYKKIKHGMMQELLTGRTRLI